MNEDKEGKKYLEVVKGNNENIDGECFLYLLSVGKVVFEYMDKFLEDCLELGLLLLDELEIIIF